MNAKRRRIVMLSAFMMAVSAAAFAAAEMIHSEYYRATILPKESGVYEHGEKLFIHSKSACESNVSSVRNKSMARATHGTGTLLRRWALDLSAPERATKETLTAQESFIKCVLDRTDDYWQFPNLNIAVNLQCVMDGREGNEYVVGLVGEKAKVVSQIPEEYRMPCTGDRVRKALPIVAQRKMMGAGAEGFMKACGAWDLVKPTGVAHERIAAFNSVNDEIGRYLRSSPLAKELAEEAAALSVPQVVTNTTSTMNEQGTMLTEKTEITTVTRFPRMQKLFLNCANETNCPTARQPSGRAAIASIRDAKVSADGRATLFKAALCDSPGDKELWNYYGRVLMAKGDSRGAIICFRNALKLDARFVYPIVNLACAYQALGKSELALGTAVVGRGLATDAWSVRELDRILWGGADGAPNEPSRATKPSEVFSSSEVNDKLEF